VPTAVLSVERAAQGVTSTAVLDFLRKPKRMLIEGKWVSAKSGKTFETINPANEEVLALVPEGDRADVDEAVKAARRAYEGSKWSKINPHQRARFLLTIADLIEKHVEELAILETLNNGMGISLARNFTLLAVDTFRYYAGWATKIYGETNPSDPSMFNIRCASRLASAGR
jgi:acyl-CoA reductase-like NAD-dependent aldehyde dehydrogenase